MTFNNCAVCGDPLILVHERAELTIGNRRATVEVERYRCDSCAESFFSPEQALAAQRAAAAVLREQEGLLTPNEILAIRTRLDLTQAELERVLGVGPKTVVRWERGTVFQNAATDQLLRLIAAVPAAFTFLAERAGLQVSGSTDAQGSCKVYQFKSWKNNQIVREKPSTETQLPVPEIRRENML